MNVQDWLARLLAGPASEPLDWERYSVTMAEPTWKAIWGEVEANRAYDDGLELGLRLLQATHVYREKLSPRAYESHQIRLYRTILAMLDKGERWDDYLRAWDAMLSRADLCLSLRGDALDENPALASLVRRADGGLGATRLPYGVPRPARIDVHFLHTQLGRRAVIARRLAREQDGKSASPSAERPDGLRAEDIEGRLFAAGDLAGRS